MNVKHNVSPGTIFGRLTVTGRAPSPPGQSRVYCACACGAHVDVARGGLTQGTTRSCGCLRREVSTARATKHGAVSAAEYRVWVSLRDGGRGITVCAGWADFPAFLADMGRRPAGRTAKRPAYTIDRIDNDGGYWCGKCSECVSLGRPANCRWATWVQQQNNRSIAFMVTAHGLTLNVTEWSRRGGISHRTISRRMERGWTPEQAVTKYPGRPRRPPQP